MKKVLLLQKFLKFKADSEEKMIFHILQTKSEPNLYSEPLSIMLACRLQSKTYETKYKLKKCLQKSDNRPNLFGITAKMFPPLEGDKYKLSCYCEHSPK